MLSEYCEQCHGTICAKKVPIFKPLNAEELSVITDMTGHYSYQKGEAICLEGDATRAMIIVNEGEVTLSKTDRNGKEQIIRRLSSGDFFGEHYLFTDDKYYHFSATAISDVKVCTLSKSNMNLVLKRHPEISIKLLEVLTKQLMQAEQLVQNLSTNDTDAKIAYMLLELAKKSGKEIRNKIIITHNLSREEMAKMVGITRETMSRKLSRWEHDGLIKLEGREKIVLLSVDRIQSIL